MKTVLLQYLLKTQHSKEIPHISRSVSLNPSQTPGFAEDPAQCGAPAVDGALFSNRACRLEVHSVTDLSLFF